LNYIMSRRSNIKNGESISVSSPHAVIQFGDSETSSRSNRRPKKRERSSSNFETELTSVVDSGSPRPGGGGQRSSAGVEGRKTDPAGWAVTDTSAREENIEEEEDSEMDSPIRQQPSQLRRCPRTAWSDDVVVLPRSDEDVELLANMQQNGPTYINSGFEEVSDDDGEDDCNVGEMLEELQRKIKASESQLATWKDVRSAAERDAVEARQVH